MRRIIKTKDKYNISDTDEVKGIEIEKINKEIEEVKEKCN